MNQTCGMIVSSNDVVFRELDFVRMLGSEVFVEWITSGCLAQEVPVLGAIRRGSNAGWR